MMLKATPEDKPDARQELFNRLSQIEAEIKKLQGAKQTQKKKSSGIDLTTTIIILIGVIAVFGIALATGILIQ